jgi:hypothetical protein
MENTMIFHKTELIEFHIDIKPGDITSITISSVWPQARTDRSPHVLLNLNLPPESLKALREALL